MTLHIRKGKHFVSKEPRLLPFFGSREKSGEAFVSKGPRLLPFFITLNGIDHICFIYIFSVHNINFPLINLF